MIQLGNTHRDRPKNILYVYGNGPGLDANYDVQLVAEFQNEVGDLSGAGNANNSVTQVLDTALPVSEVGYDLIFISKTVASTTVTTNQDFSDVAVPLMLTEIALLDDLNMGPTGSSNLGETDITVSSTLLDPFTGDVTIFTSAAALGYVDTADLGAGAQALATSVTSSDEKAAFFYETGSLGIGSFVMPERRVWYGASQGASLLLTSDGLSILKILAELAMHLR